MKTSCLPLLTALVCIGAFSTNAAPTGKTQQLTSPDQTPEGLEKSDWASIRAAHAAWQHGFLPVEGGWQARNLGQQWTTKFDARGFLTTPKDGGWTWGLELQSYGVGEKQTSVAGHPAMKAEGQRLTYQWDATLQEWWVNDQRGLEHGYTVARRPCEEKERQGDREAGEQLLLSKSPSLQVSKSPLIPLSPSSSPLAAHSRRR